MKVTFIIPSIGREPNVDYIRTWQMEPLAIATLSAITPDHIEKKFFDDRMEEIDYSDHTDLVAMSVETYTARRAYQISLRYRKMGIPVIMGGFHPTLAPDDALEHADSIVIGEGEESWPQLLADFESGKMHREYRSNRRSSLAGRFPDRSIYEGKPYLPIGLVETARGCEFHCEFCSITRFFNATHEQRPVADVIKEITTLKQKNIFFTDDNIAVNKKRFEELLKALIPLKIQWSAQTSIEIYKDENLLRLMRDSGCVCVLIGFETLNPAVLSKMNKASANNPETYETAAIAFKKNGIGIYGTFVFGYDGDNIESFPNTLEFSKRNGFFFSAFNHLVPFPGTRLYERLAKEGRLTSSKWWLSDQYHFGDVAYQVKGMSGEELSNLCLAYRRRFYSPSSVVRRLLNWRVNARSLSRLILFLTLNSLSRNDVSDRSKLRLGSPGEPI